ncbi:MAG: HEAT repeat domain-containing protein [candidate division Zixibacteria bacterium]|nr:HEAT repeat domain-containing protein [candidate division Zixibacteria bacterium]
MQEMRNSVILNIFKELNSAIKRLSTYPQEHPVNKTSLQKTYQLFEEFLKTKGELTLGRVENKLVLEEENLDLSSVSNKLFNIMDKQNIKSISFSPGLDQGELKSFLLYFILKTEESLSSYLQNNEVAHIRLNQLRYEVISEDEEVVKSDYIQNVNLKSELSRVIREHPDLLKDILLGKSIEKGKLKEIFGKDILPGTESLSDEQRFVKGGEGAGICGEGIDVKKLMEELKVEIDNMSDDELLVMLSSHLKDFFKDQAEMESSSEEALKLVKKALEKRDQQRLLPRLKELLSGYGIIDERYFDLLINQTYKSKEEQISRNLEFLQKLEQGQLKEDEVEKRKMEIIYCPDEKLKKKIIDSLVEKLDSSDEKLRETSLLALKKLMELSISEEKEGDFVYIKDRLTEQPEKNIVTIKFHEGYFEILSSNFSNLVKVCKLDEVNRMLEKADLKTQNETLRQKFHSLKKEFIDRISSEQNLDLLLQPLFAGFSTQKGKETEKLLQNLNREKVAQKLVGIFTVEKRHIRIWALRLLSDLGKEAVEVISNLLSSKEKFKRSANQNLLEDESWYIIRNALFVLGNIDSQVSVKLILEFARDPDPRVRLEVLKVLEKKKKEKAIQVLLELIRDTDEEVRKKAVSLIALSGEKGFVPGLKELFFTPFTDRKKILTVMVKIDENNSRDFIMKVATDDEFLPPAFSGKEKYELQIAALEILGKIGTPKDFIAIENFLKRRKKGFLWRLNRDEVIEKAQEILSQKDKEISLSKL